MIFLTDSKVLYNVREILGNCANMMNSQPEVSSFEGSPKDVQTFFDRAAANYQSSSEAWPWRWLRRNEQAAVQRQLGDLKGETVLDFGSGDGYYTRLALHLGAKHVVAVDFSQNMVTALPTKNVTGVVGDASKVNLDDRFSKIVMAGLLEFTPDVPAIFENAHNHAQEGAILVVLAPKNNIFGRAYWAHHLRHGIRINLFSSAALVELGERAHWKCISDETVAPFSIAIGFKAIK